MTSKQLSPQGFHQLQTGLAFGLSDTGSVRSSNEDSFLIDDILDLVVIADGMGGHEMGEVASAEALLAMRDYLDEQRFRLNDANDIALHMAHSEDDPDNTWNDRTMPAVVLLFEAIEHANACLYNQNQAAYLRDGRGMGTTLTGYWKPGPDLPLTIFHVGDSRLYRWREGMLDQLTHDQTLYQEAIDMGVEENLPPQNMLLQAVGPASTVKPDIYLCPIQRGDLLMLCSDGLHGSVPYEDIVKVLEGAQPDQLAECCASLIRLAKNYGGRDNITVVLMWVGN